MQTGITPMQLMPSYPQGPARAGALPVASHLPTAVQMMPGAAVPMMAGAVPPHAAAAMPVPATMAQPMQYVHPSVAPSHYAPAVQAAAPAAMLPVHYGYSAPQPQMAGYGSGVAAPAHPMHLPVSALAGPVVGEAFDPLTGALTRSVAPMVPIPGALPHHPHTSM